jgi:hypothetical protein
MTKLLDFEKVNDNFRKIQGSSSIVNEYRRI